MPSPRPLIPPNSVTMHSTQKYVAYKNYYTIQAVALRVCSVRKGRILDDVLINRFETAIETSHYLEGNCTCVCVYATIITSKAIAQRHAL